MKYTLKDTLLHLEAIDIAYGDNLVIKDFTMTEKDVVIDGQNTGQFIAILGRSGRGKSSLFKVMTGLLKPTSGEVMISNGVGGAKLVKEGDGQSEYNIAQNILQLLQSKYNEEPHYEVDIIESITKYMTRKIANMQKQGYEVKVEVIGQYVKELVNKIQINDLEPEDAYNIASNIIGHSMPKGQPQQGQGPARPTAPVQ